MSEDKDSKSRPDKSIKRRAALMKLGLSALAVYAAPSVVHLDRSANAQVRPSCNGKSKGNPWCNTGKGKGKGKSKGNSKGKSRGKRSRRSDRNRRRTNDRRNNRNARNNRR